MEEDIKILEDYLLGKKMEYGSGYIYFRQFVALENLIKGYRELEEENNKFRNGEIVTGKLMAVTKKHLFNDLKDYISKSVIREVIEELKEIKRVQEDNPFTSPVYIKELEYGIQVLQELLDKEG